MKKQEAEHAFDNYLLALNSLGISQESTRYAKEHVTLVSVKSRKTLLLPGEICKDVYLILEGGFVCRYIHEKTGVAKTINFYLQDVHPLMVCLDSYFTQTATNCELRAVRNSYVAALPKLIIDKLREEDWEFAKFYHEGYTTAMVEENELKSKLIVYSPKEMFEYIMSEMPTVLQQVPSKYIAELCGISPEWLSKLKKRPR